MSPKGLLSFTIGGVLLIFAVYLVLWGALSETRIQYSSSQPLIYGSILGFVAFLLLGVGLYSIIESAVSSKK